MLLFFCLAYLIAFFLYLESKKPLYLYLTSLGILLAILTKSIAGLLFGPGLLIYLLIKSELIPLLRNRHFYVSAILCLLGVAAFYLSREFYNPGYLHAVWANEIGGRYSQSMEAHRHPFFYYFQKLPGRFKYYWPFSLLGMLFVWSGIKEERTLPQRFSLYSTLLVISFLLVISNSDTKLAWYDLPVYPFLSLLAAIGWTKIIWTKGLQIIPHNKRQVHKNWVLPVVTVLLLVIPYKTTLDYCMREDPVKYDSPEACGHYIAHLKSEHDYFITSLFYRPDIRFYYLSYGLKGYKIIPFDPNHPPGKGKKVMICGDQELRRVKAARDFEVLHQMGKCLFVQMK